ncbi:MAG: hypothetical protein IIZ00_01560, partial [Oscillospiraceae bacterium]|nr:hypothetical protein [Oscillospiraceae bacterium]
PRRQRRMRISSFFPPRFRFFTILSQNAAKCKRVPAAGLILSFGGKNERLSGKKCNFSLYETPKI